MFPSLDAGGDSMDYGGSMLLPMGNFAGVGYGFWIFSPLKMFYCGLGDVIASP